jgi:hypothetical protein
MQQRWGLTNRLQELVTAPCEQAPPAAAATTQRRGRGQRGKQAAAAAAAAAGDAPQQVVTDSQLAKQAMAAAHAGRWQQHVQLWDQLTGRQPALGRRQLAYLEQQQRRGTLVAVDGLCEALVGAWAAAQQQVAVRMQLELAEAVVVAVQAAEQQQVMAGRGRRRG